MKYLEDLHASSRGIHPFISLWPEICFTESMTARLRKLLPAGSQSCWDCISRCTCSQNLSNRFIMPFYKELNQLNTADLYVICRFIESERSCHGFWTAYCLCWNRPNSNSFGTTVLYLNVVKKTFLPRPILVQQNWTWGTCWATLESAMLFARQRASIKRLRYGTTLTIVLR